MITDFKVSAFFYPYYILKYKKFLDNSEFSSKQQLVEYQNKKLQDLIKYAYQHVPYYHELLNKNKIIPSDIKTFEDLELIPPLTKDIVRERFTDLTSRIARKFKPILTRTSGSTGTPLQFYLDKNINIAKFAIFWRVWGWTGYRLRQRWANICGPEFENNIIFKYLRTMNALYISSFDMTKNNANIILKELLKYKPTMLRGYPSAIYLFVKLVDHKEELKQIGLKSIVTSSETLLDFQRDFIQGSFRCNVYDNYTQWEQVCIISECEHQTKHHHMEYGIMELLNDNNEPVPSGAIGEITATSLVNMAMPFIRYKTGDFAQKSNKACHCGRKHDVVERIDGRIEDIIVTPDGRHVGRMDAAFKYNKGFDFAQIVQDEIEAINVFLVANKDFDSNEQMILEKHIRDRVGNIIKINFEFKNGIKPSENGKMRFVINNYLKNKKKD